MTRIEIGERLLEARAPLALVAGVPPRAIQRGAHEHRLAGGDVADDVARRVLARARCPVDAVGRQRAEEADGAAPDAVEVVGEAAHAGDHLKTSRAMTSFWICEVPS